MSINDKIKDEKLKYHVYLETAKILALQSGKIDKYEYITSKEILLFDQSRTKGRTKFTCFLLDITFEKQMKTIEEQGKNQVELLEVLKSYTQNLTIKDVTPEKILNEECKK